MRPERLPTFLVIGAARSGTTSLCGYLAQHPDVCMSPVKEPNFFAADGHMPTLQGPGEDRLEWVTDPARYERLFESCGAATARGEASTAYLYSADAPRRMREAIPDARLVAILRDPVERAYSAFTYLRERGSEPCQSFVEALEAEDERVAQSWSHIWHYRRMGFYAAQLRRYYDLFPAEQVLVLLTDDLERDPRGTVETVFEHIRVDPSFAPDTGIRHNVSGDPRTKLLAPLLAPNRVTTKIRPVAGRLLHPLAARLKQRALVKPTMPGEAVERLSAAYAADVRELETMLGRDLSSWLPSGRPSATAARER